MKLRIRNWDKWQSYRRDRGQPPWIKVYRALLHDPNWVALTDKQRGQLVGIWLLAADRNGTVPADPAILKKICHMDSEPDVQVFISYGFMEPDATLTPAWRQDDASVTPDRRQVDANMTPQSRDRVETEERREEEPLVGVTADRDPVLVLHEHFNQKRGGKPLRLTAERRVKYKARRKTFSDDDLMRCADVALADPWLRGENDRHRDFGFPETVYKSDASVDRWLTPQEPRLVQQSPEDYAEQRRKHEEAVRIQRELEEKIAMAGVGRRLTANERS